MLKTLFSILILMVFLAPRLADAQPATLASPVPTVNGSVKITTATTYQLILAAVPVNSGLGEVYVTSDGGETWSAAPVSG